MMELELRRVSELLKVFLVGVKTPRFDMLSTNQKAGIDGQVMKMDMKMVKMDVYGSVFFSELNEKYVFKCALSDGSRLEGIVLC